MRSSEGTGVRRQAGATPTRNLAKRTWGRLHRARPRSAPSTSCRRSPARRRSTRSGFCVGGTILATALAVLPRGRASRSVTVADDAAGLQQQPASSTSSSTRRWSSARADDHPPARAAAACSRSQNSLDVQLPGRTTWWCGTTSSATTPRAKAPPPFDLLYRNGDGTNLPGRCTAGTCATPTSRTTSSSPASRRPAGVPVDLSLVRRAGLPVRLARGSHRAVEGATSQPPRAGGKKRFVLGASGHIIGRDQPAGEEEAQLLVAPAANAAAPASRGLGRRGAGSAAAGGDGRPGCRAAARRIAAPRRPGGHLKPTEPGPRLHESHA